MFALLEMPLTKLPLHLSSPAHLPLWSGAFSTPPSLRHTSTPASSKLFLFNLPEHLFVLPGALHQNSDINGTLNRSALSAAGIENSVLACHCAFEAAPDENSGKTMTFLIIPHSEKGLCYRLQNTVSIQKMECPVQYSPTLEPPGKATPSPGQSCLQASCCLQQAQCDWLPLSFSSPPSFTH